MIRWKRGDYIKLGQAVAAFNKEIDKNLNKVKGLILPEKIEYSELRDMIQTRKGLNEYINALKKIKLPGSFEPVKIENGLTITQYQKRELDLGRKSAINELIERIADIEAQTKLHYKISSDVLEDAYKSNKQKELEVLLNDYKNLYSLSGKNFSKRALQVKFNQTELKYRRAYVFKENYMKVMEEKYSDFDNYDKFVKWANSHKNPISFYEALPDNEYYPDDLQYQSDVVFSEDDFNSFLQSLGIKLEEG